MSSFPVGNILLCVCVNIALEQASQSYVQAAFICATTQAKVSQLIFLSFPGM